MNILHKQRLRLCNYCGFVTFAHQWFILSERLVFGILTQKIFAMAIYLKRFNRPITILSILMDLMLMFIILEQFL